MSQTQVISNHQKITDEDKFQVLDEKDWKKYDKRTLGQVLLTDLQNYVYFFTPLVVIYNLGW